MGHPSLAPGLNELIDFQIMYRNMTLGEQLMVTGIDAVSKLPSSFKLEVARLVSQTGPDPVISAVFRFKDSGFQFHGDDGKPRTVPAGTFAESGTAATHIPHFVLFMIGLGGISPGRDYSLESLAGGTEKVIVESIQNIVRVKPTKGWREPKREVDRFLARIKKRDKKRELMKLAEKKRLAKRLETSVTIRTENSTYLLGPIQENGERTFQKEGSPSVERAKDAYLETIGARLSINIYSRDDWRPMLTSYTIEVL